MTNQTAVSRVSSLVRCEVYRLCFRPMALVEADRPLACAVVAGIGEHSKRTRLVVVTHRAVSPTPATTTESPVTTEPTTTSTAPPSTETNTPGMPGFDIGVTVVAVFVGIGLLRRRDERR